MHPRSTSLRIKTCAVSVAVHPQVFWSRHSAPGGNKTGDILPCGADTPIGWGRCCRVGGGGGGRGWVGGVQNEVKGIGSEAGKAVQ